MNTARLAALVALGIACSPAFGDAKSDMQKKLNDEVMAEPFDAGDVQKATAYADDAMKKGIKPPNAPRYWQPGWTCSSLTTYPQYSYYDYRNCVYYHRYYGRYW